MRRLKFLFAFALAAALFGYGAWRFPIPLQGAPAVLRALLAALCVSVVALAWGRSFLTRLKLYHVSLSEEAVVSFSLGLVGLSLLGSLLAGVGVLYDWVLWIGLGLIALTQWDHVQYFGGNFLRNLRVKQPWDGSSTEVLSLVAGALGLIAVLALCLAPVTFYDALNYHLPAVQRMVATGRDLPQADNLFTWFPDIAQPLWAMAALLSDNAATNTAAPALLNAILALVLGLALVEASSRWLSERKLWLAPALAWTQPLLMLSFGAFSPDPWMAFYAFLSLFAFLIALEEVDQARQGVWLGLAALMAGAACAAKPVALMHAVALLLLTLVQAWKRPAWRQWRWALRCGVLFVVPLLPWLLRGWALHSNPLYPFGLSLGGHLFFQGGPASYFGHIQSFGGEWWELPWNFFFEPFKLAGGGHLSGLFLALLPLAVAWRYTRAQRSLAAYVGVSLALWCLGPHVLRYALFFVPALCLLAAHGVVEVGNWSASRGWAYAWRLLVLASLFLGAGQTLLIATKDFQPWNVALGLQDPVEYLAQRRVPQAEAAVWIRNRNRPRQRVLVLGDARVAYLPPQSLAASAFDEHPFKAWAAQATSPQDLGAIVRRKGYDFVLFSRAEWARVEEPAQPFYWSRADAETALRVKAWLESLALEHPSLELSGGAGRVFDLR